MLPGAQREAEPPGQNLPLVRAVDLHKHFGGVPALRGVSLELWPGEVHGLVGANGAGKSTFIKILAGVEQPDAGTLFINGDAVRLQGPQDAASRGLGFIHQELNLVPRLNVLENIMLGAAKPTRLGMINWPQVHRDVVPVARKVGIRFGLDTPIAALSTAEKWLVSICRALVRQVRLLVMDEPTASLSAQESENLFRIVRELSADGVAVLYVSHRLDEILDLCARVTAFRDGQRVMQAPREKFTRRQLVEAIVGGEFAGEHPLAATGQPPAGGETLLQVRGLTRGKVVRDVSFSVRRGEVLGLAGLVGAGRSELARMIFGADRPDRGQMTLAGKDFSPRSTADAMRAGIGLAPEERRSQGLVIGKSVAFNLGLAMRPALQLAPWLPLLRMRHRAAWAKRTAEQFRVKTVSVDTPVVRLSGGNQQKVLIGKWMARSPKLLILDEPSRGVDVGARAEIHRLIRERAAEGMAAIVISSDAEELPGLCDRVIVMVEGQLAAELFGAGITREAIVQSSYRHGESTPPVLTS